MASQGKLVDRFVVVVVNRSFPLFIPALGVTIMIEGVDAKARQMMAARNCSASNLNKTVWAKERLITEGKSPFVRMIPLKLHNQTYFFSIIHVTRQPPDRLIYGILINAESYYLSKTIGIEDCTQLDNKALLDHALLLEICDIMTQFEVAYEKYPSLEFINEEIIRTLEQIRNMVLP